MSEDPTPPVETIEDIAEGEDSVEATRMSFADHLDELRRCLIRALLGVAVATAVTLTFGREILEILFHPLWIVQQANGLQPNLQALAPTDAFSAYLKIALLSGLILAMPWVLHQLWGFIAAGLYRRERKFVRGIVGSSSILFFAGVLFLYYLVLPIVLQFFITFNRAFAASDLRPSAFDRLLLTGGDEPRTMTPPHDALRLPVLQEDPSDAQPGEAWVNAVTRRLVLKTPSGLWSTALEPGPTSPAMQSQFAIDYYLSFVLMLALAFGIAFETPIVVCFLAWSGLVPTRTMVRGRRYAILGVVVIASVLTPPDVLSQLLLATPMYVLFELGLILARMKERNKSAQPTAAA